MRWIFGLCIWIPLTLGAQSLEDLSWLAGHWSDGEFDEVWLQAAGGPMPGLNRRRGSAEYEQLMIVEQQGRITYLAAPNGRPASSFDLTRVDEQYAEFENPKHDFPQRLSYRRVGEQLQVSASTLDGRKALHWTWRRQ